MSKQFAKETDLVTAFRDWMTKPRWSSGPAAGAGWTVYPETAGWDLLLAHDLTGIQIGVEAKLSLNAKVLEQALPCHRYASETGPDYRAVLVPSDACQLHMSSLAAHLGVTVIKISARDDYERARGQIWRCNIDLPTEHSRFHGQGWFSWLPSDRHALPAYVPDVVGGDSCPVALTDWKIRAIKLMIWLDRHGCVTRKDMKAIGISPTRWCDHYHGFLSPDGNGGYVRNGRTPDLRAQHPVNYAQIEADVAEWSKQMPARLAIEAAA